MSAEFKEESIVAPSITSMTWRVDVILSSSSVNQVMQPCVILQLGLSDGTFHTLELPIRAFHDLRFRLAEGLHAMNKLEANYLFTLSE